MIVPNEPPHAPEWQADPRCCCNLGECTVCGQEPSIGAHISLGEN